MLDQRLSYDLFHGWQKISWMENSDLLHLKLSYANLSNIIRWTFSLHHKLKKVHSVAVTHQVASHLQANKKNLSTHTMPDQFLLNSIWLFVKIFIAEEKVLSVSCMVSKMLTSSSSILSILGAYQNRLYLYRNNNQSEESLMLHTKLKIMCNKILLM